MSLELPEKDRDLMRGVIDLHVHVTPDIFARPYDEVELARQAWEVGYRAMLFKSQAVINADRMYLFEKDGSRDRCVWGSSAKPFLEYIFKFIEKRGTYAPALLNPPIINYILQT